MPHWCCGYITHIAPWPVCPVVVMGLVSTKQSTQLMGPGNTQLTLGFNGILLLNQRLNKKDLAPNSCIYVEAFLNGKLYCRAQTSTCRCKRDLKSTYQRSVTTSLDTYVLNLVVFSVNNYYYQQ